MTISVDEIIERLGGAEAAARRLGVGTEAVRKWRQSHSIPARHWPALLAATGLALHDLPGAPQPDASAPASPPPAPPPPSCSPTAPSSGAWASARPPRRRTGGRGLLQHRSDRLPGNADRPVLRRPGHHLHLPAHRQCRREPRGHRSLQHRRPRPGREAGGDRPLQLPRPAAPRRLAARAGEARHRRRGHARAHQSASATVAPPTA